MDELVRRCRAYVEAGAETLMPHGMETMEEWEFMGSEMRKLGVPLIASLSAGLIFTPRDQPRRAVPSVAQLEDMGWTMLNYANHLLHMHMTITQRYIRDLMAAPHDIGRWLEDVMDNGERMGILGLPMWRALEEAFENPEKVASRYKKTREKDNYVYRTLDDAREQLDRALQAKGISRD